MDTKNKQGSADINLKRRTFIKLSLLGIGGYILAKISGPFLKAANNVNNLAQVSAAGSPSTPTSLSATSPSASQVNLSWSPSIDDGGVAGYRVYRSLTPGTPPPLQTPTPVPPPTQTPIPIPSPTGTPDSARPTVVISSPTSGANLSSFVTVQATASDNVAVVGVQFKLDGNILGAEDTASPYSTIWNTNTAANGSHTLTAIARDAAGNTTTSVAVSVNVSNAVTTTPAPTIGGLDIARNTFIHRPSPSVPLSPGTQYSKHQRFCLNTDTGIASLYGGDYTDYTYPAVLARGGRNASWENIKGYNVATDTWSLLLPEGADTGTGAATPGYPIGVCVGAMCYSASTKALWLTGGEARAMQYSLTATTAVYPPGLVNSGLWAFKNGGWTHQGPSPDAGLDSSAKVNLGETMCMVEDYINNELIVAGYSGGAGAVIAAYTLGGVVAGDGVNRDNWVYRTSGDLPAGRDNLRFASNNLYAVDTKRHRMIFYTERHGTWAYNFTDRSVVQLSPQLLAPYSNFSMIYDEENDCTILFGGRVHNPADPTNIEADSSSRDWLVLSHSDYVWRKAVLTGSMYVPSDGAYTGHGQMYYDKFNRVVVIYDYGITMFRLNLSTLAYTTAPGPMGIIS